MDLRKNLSFGFETTFTIPEWWNEPGFCSGWETPHKLGLMKKTADGLIKRIGGNYKISKDPYQADQFELFDANGVATFKVTSEPGSIEINTPPALVADIKKMMAPLYEAAEEAGLVTYRTWWYGWKGGTSGGCHVNMAGFTDETNPIKADPILVLKYFAYFHNRPWLHYPFMGPDIGQGGNCMRMDEHGEEISSSMLRFEEARKKIESGWTPTCDDIYEFFVGVPLREVKHCAPTLRKVRAPYYLIEDRAMEMLRSADECLSVCELRVRILEGLQKQNGIEELKNLNPKMHGEDLSYGSLWKNLQTEAKKWDMDPVQFKTFMDRQFPVLEMGVETGVGVPKTFYLREGRRPRKIMGVNEAVGSLVLSKKVDTRYKRLEFHILGNSPVPIKKIRINGLVLTPGEYGVLLDCYLPFSNEIGKPVLLDIETLDEENRTHEKVTFDPYQMMFIKRKDTSPVHVWPKKTEIQGVNGFYSVESNPDFAVEN
jgi:hypothetical protein